MYHHPLTDQAMAEFDEIWEKVIKYAGKHGGREAERLEGQKTFIDQLFEKARHLSFLAFKFPGLQAIDQQHSIMVLVLESYHYSFQIVSKGAN
jgi:hypothetical protein